MSTLSRLILFTSIVALLSGCSVISKQVNKEWPPLSIIEQQRSAIVQSFNKTLPTVDAALFINREDFKKRLLPLAKTQLGKLIGKDLGDVTIRKLTINDAAFIQQGLSLNANFEIHSDKHNISLAGTLSGASAFSASDVGIFVKPAFSNIYLKRLPRKEEASLLAKLGEKASVALVNQLLNTFIGNINGQLFNNPIKVPVDLSFSKRFKASEFVKDGDLSLSTEQDINISQVLSSYSPIVMPSGIGFIASRSDYISITPPTHDMPFIQMFDAYTQYLDTVLHSQLGVTLDTFVKNTGAYINKEFIADTMNQGFNGVNLQLEMRDFIDLPDDKRNFSKTIGYHEPDRIPSCKGIYTKYKPHSCGSCKQASCDGPCRMKSCPSCKPLKIWSSAKDCAKRAACEADNAVRKTGCAVCKTGKAAEKALCDTKVAACKSKHVADKAVHDIKEEAKVAKCKTLREGTRFINSLKEVAHLQGEGDVTGSGLAAIVKEIAFSPTLNKLAMKADIKAYADAWLKVNINPEATGHIACLFNYSNTISSRGKAAERERFLEASVTFVPAGDELKIVAKIPSQTFDLRLSPSPYNSLVRDPKFVMNCTLLTMAIPSVAGYSLLTDKDIPESIDILLGNLELDVKEQEFEVDISPIHIGKNNKLILTPFSLNKAIGFNLD